MQTTFDKEQLQEIVRVIITKLKEKKNQDKNRKIEELIEEIKLDYLVCDESQGKYADDMNNFFVVFDIEDITRLFKNKKRYNRFAIISEFLSIQVKKLSEEIECDEENV